MTEEALAIIKYSDIWDKLTYIERETIKQLSRGDIKREQLCTFLNAIDRDNTWTTRGVKIFIEHLIFNKRIPIGFHPQRGLFLVKTLQDKTAAKAACLKMARSLIERANFTEKIVAERENLLPFEIEYYDITLKGVI